MNAIILSAGSATRLGELTKELPKGLLEINGKTIIQRQIEIYRKNGIENIIVIVGPHSDKYSFEDVLYVKDDEYQKHEVLGSLMKSSKHMNEGFIMSYADIVFEEKVIQDILSFKGDIGIGIDFDWEKNYEDRKLHPIEQADNVIVKDGKIQKIRKNISAKNNDELLGEFIGIIKLSKKGSEIFLERYAKLKDSHVGEFQDANSFEKAYLTDILQDLIDLGHKIESINIDKIWQEIDTPEDLLTARKKIK